MPDIISNQEDKVSAQKDAVSGNVAEISNAYTHLTKAQHNTRNIALLKS